MDFKYCSNCGKKTGHKRTIGWGTQFASRFTFGVSTLAIPFYPKRCIICGSKDIGQELNTSTDTISNSITYYDSENNENADIPPLEEQLKKCSMCAEKIKLEALKCRYCGETFDKNQVAMKVAEFKEKVNNKHTDTENWKDRILCCDGNCIGVIGSDGYCKECGEHYSENKAKKNTFQEKEYSIKIKNNPRLKLVHTN
jgi:hypothetical protein